MKMESSKKMWTGNRSSLSWILNGAVLAPLVVILFSYLHVDESMREVPVLLSVSIAGALAGKLAFAINKPGRPRSWKSPLLLLLSLLFYSVAVLVGFLMARLGPF